MTDFETKLRASLRERADEAPTAGDLAGGARRRLRRRRTTIVTAAVAAAVAIGAPSVLLDRDPASTGEVATDPTSPPATTAPTTIETPSGVRTESWRDVTFEVPAEWGIGNPTAWCVGGELPQDATPTVGRPTDATPRIACNPTDGYGVTVGPADLYEAGSGDVFAYSAAGNATPRYADGTWVSIWYDDEVAVTVATPDRALTERIVGSVERIDGVDANGCAPLLGDAEGATSDGSASASVCRYDDADDLDWSRRLDQAEAARLTDAIDAAPTRTTDYDCPTEDGLARTALLDGGAYEATVVTDATCEGNNGVFLSGEVREVTDEVRAALERPDPVG